ncbi:MAG: FixH family protein [Alphaproteobacteria bacterium]
MRPYIYAMLLGALAGAAGTFGVALAQTAERAKADIACMPAAQDMTYDCIIKLSGRDSGKPLAGATLTVGAEMPSMPMAHNVRPVAAKEAEPGTYAVRIELEMHGEWALKLDIAGPMRDRIVQKMDFAGEHKH